MNIEFYHNVSACACAVLERSKEKLERIAFRFFGSCKNSATWKPSHTTCSITSESLKKTNVSAHSQNNEIMIDMQRLEVGDR